MASVNFSIRYVDDNHALVTKAFAKKANYFGTPEFKLWREYLAQFPNAQMVTKSIKKNPEKRTNRNKTYENMAGYIRTRDDAKEMMAQFEIHIKRSKVQANPYRYVLAWFEMTFAADEKQFADYVASQEEEKAKKNNIFYLETVQDRYLDSDEDQASNF